MFKGLVLEESNNEYTVTEFAKLINKSPRTVRYWIQSGKLATRKVGGKRFITSDPAEYAEEGEKVKYEERLLKIEKDVKKHSENMKKIENIQRDCLIAIRELNNKLYKIKANFRKICNDDDLKEKEKGT